MPIGVVITLAPKEKGSIISTTSHSKIPSYYRALLALFLYRLRTPKFLYLHGFSIEVDHRTPTISTNHCHPNPCQKYLKH
jgi:hypothetical protein